MSLHRKPLSPMPQGLKPMLAHLALQPFDRSDWLFEMKWNGYRALAEIRRGKVELFSRYRESWKERYREIAEDLSHIVRNAIVDGEIVVINEKGVPDFALLQSYPLEKQGQLVYYAFDLLYLDGVDLRNQSLIYRKSLLAHVLPKRPHLQLSEYIEQSGKALFELAKKQGIEGIVAKDGRSRYIAGKRSDYWLKIKTHARQQVVIGGFKEQSDGLLLLLGVFHNDQFFFVGQVEVQKDIPILLSQLHSLLQEKSPFAVRPRSSGEVTWVKPQTVCQVSFQEWTKAGTMRDIVYEGLRPDVLARSVVREQAVIDRSIIANERVRV